MSDVKVLDSENREAAAVTLRAMLDRKVRGDRITAAEIVESTGFAEWRSFSNRINTWAKRRGFVLFSEPRNGWRIGLAHEHTDYAERKRRTALRAERRGLQALVATPAAELDDRQSRRHQFELIRSQARTCTAVEHDREISNKLIAGSDRIPLRVVAGK